MSVSPKEVHKTLGRYMLADGFDLVFDTWKSKGCRLYDSKNEKFLLDCFSFFASAPLGSNHPALDNPDFIEKIGKVAVNKPSNSDNYTVELAEFVDTFGKIALPDSFKHLFFVSGGSLAVENGLKVSFDWKVRKNIASGKGELGSKVIHFKDAFHGRTGYTLPMTNTFDPNKTRYFPVLDWPRVVNPRISFPLTDESLEEVKDLEKQAIDQIKDAISDNPDDIACLIIEPIQGEGGDNHFRPEFFQKVRRICDENDVMFMVDEVQSGLGLTGKMWAYEHFDAVPDILAFGKKTQVCGIMVNSRVDDVEDNVFNVSSRINSTWGGNIVDMVRCQKYLEVIKEENLVKNAEVQGKRLLDGLNDLMEKHSGKMFNARGRGLMCAFDLETPEKRDRVKDLMYSNGMVILGCGEKSIRFRPPLIISSEEVDEALGILDKSLSSL